MSISDEFSPVELAVHVSRDSMKKLQMHPADSLSCSNEHEVATTELTDANCPLTMFQLRICAPWLLALSEAMKGDDIA